MGIDDEARYGRGLGHGRGTGPVQPPRSAGLELIGGALFLFGCLPAAAVAKALFDGTDLLAPGLGGTAKLASFVAHWVGPWPALVTAAAIAVIGALLVVGSLRAEPLKAVAGVAVSGLGLAAVASALYPATVALPGAGGSLGDGFASLFPTTVSVILGLGIIGFACWLAFTGQVSEPALDEDGFAPLPIDDDGSISMTSRISDALGASATAVRQKLRRDPRVARDKSASLGASNEQRRIQTRRTKHSKAPATLGDALARGQTEGVSHDEAAALAPDDKALSYMESVWRNASESYVQTDPIPPSPYPEDPRLRGELPAGTKPLDAAQLAARDAKQAAEAAAREQAAEAAASAPAPSIKPVGGAAGSLLDAAAGGVDAASAAMAGAAESDPFAGPSYAAQGTEHAQQDADVAPFDFPDQLAAEPELPPSPTFSAPPAASIETFTRPQGVTPITPELAGAEPAEFKLPPQPSWESNSGDEDLGLDVLPEESDAITELLREANAAKATTADDLGIQDEAAEIEVEDIPDVDLTTGRWPRREDEVDEESAELLSGEAEDADVAAEVEAEVEDVAEADEETAVEAVDDVDEDLAAEEVEGELEDDEEVEYEYVDEDGNPIDPEDIDEEWETVDEDEDEAGEEAAELEEGEDPEEDPDEEEAEEDAELADPELADDEEWVEEDEEDEGEEAELEEGELEEGEEVEYEYVDEDGNPIDPADLEDGEWEEVEEDEEAAELEDEDDAALEAATNVEEPEEALAEVLDEVSEDVSEDVSEEVPEEFSDEAAEETPTSPLTSNVAGAEDIAPAAEPQVIIEPQAPPAVAAAAASGAASNAGSTSASQPAAGSVSSDGERLLEAGRIVVREGRVAVSLLQRAFGCEFGEACEVLDELQKEGLIGPYKGGKARDILLSETEWENRFARS